MLKFTKANAWILFVIYLSVFSNAKAQEPVKRDYFVDPGVILVENWDGWGTSLAWWADVLGGLKEINVIDVVTRAFFHPDNLNFNIIRYVIGGTTPKEITDYPCGDYRTGAATESYLDGPGLGYNWTRDARQREILVRAKALGVNVFEAFSNSPPQWMTISGCSKGNPLAPLLHSNFGAARADEFSEYVTTVIKHFHENLGITFTTFAPFNEPFGLGGIGSWFGEAASQEGCNMNRTVMAAVVQSLYKAITDKNMDFLSITTADETQVTTALGTQEFLRDQGLSHMISKVNVHGYWDTVGNRRDLLSILCNKEGHRLWMDEMGWGRTPISNMTQGLDLANRVVKDVRYMLPSAWIYWQAMEGLGGWGLLTLPYEGSQTVNDIEYNSGFYAMMQFSKYIKQGYKIVYSSDEDSIAAISQDATTLVIVTINNGLTPLAKHFDLRLYQMLLLVKATRTSPYEANVDDDSASIDSQRILRVTTVPESVTTLVVTGAVVDQESKPNRIINGNFENQVTSWELEIGSSGEGGINSQFPWRGDRSGFLGSIANNTLRRLSQIIKIPGSEAQSNQVFVTAWCSTSGSGTKLAADIIYTDESISTVGETAIIGGQVYRVYSLTFKAMGGDRVKIYLDSVEGLSYIDDVSLRYVEVQTDPNSSNYHVVSSALMTFIVISKVFSLV